MPKQWIDLPRQKIEDITAIVKTISGRLTKITDLMDQHGLPFVQSPWANLHGAQLAAVSTIIKQTLDEMEDQIVAMKLNQPTRVEQNRERNTPKTKKKGAK